MMLFCSLLGVGVACSNNLPTGPDVGAYNDENGVRLYVDRFAYDPSQTVKVTIENRTAYVLDFDFCPIILEKYEPESEVWSDVRGDLDEKDYLSAGDCSGDMRQLSPKGNVKLYLGLNDEDEGIYRFRVPSLMRNNVRVYTENGGFLSTAVFMVER